MGSIRQRVTSSDFSFQYTGRENDGTGLYYYRARYYSPALQRFISEDPIELEGGVNLYAYVDGSPINLTDLFGEAGKKGERGQAGTPSGSPNEFKKYKPDPNDPTKVIYKDPNGREVKKAKPPGFDEYWKKKHPDQVDQGKSCKLPKKDSNTQESSMIQIPAPTPQQQQEIIIGGATITIIIIGADILLGF